MENKQRIIDAATTLKLHYVKVDLDEKVHKAQIEKPSYMEFLADVLTNEVEGRRKREMVLFPVKKEDAVAFFNLVNLLHEHTSVIITTNKAPTEWAETLEDTVLASALLDRLLYKCEVIRLKGTSYRMENRKTIFKRENNKEC